jgi:hypothetical protein
MNESRPTRAAPATQPTAKCRRRRGARKPQESTGLRASMLGLNGMLESWRDSLPRAEYRHIVAIGTLIFEHENEALTEGSL